MLDVVSLSQVSFAIFPMDKNIEQRICIKFWIENGIPRVESLKMLQKAYGGILTFDKMQRFILGFD